MRILIIKFRNIGDVLLMSPLITNLAQHYINAKIDVAVNLETKAMLEFNPGVNNLICYDRNIAKKLNFFAKTKYEIQFIRSFRKKYDVIINLTSGDRGNYIARFSQAKIVIGYQSSKFLFKNLPAFALPSQQFRHTLETNLDPLRALGIPIYTKKVDIFWSNTDEKKVDEILTKQLQNTTEFVHIHPVSRWLFKCINDKIFAKIIDYLEITLNKKVVITASSETRECEKVQNIMQFCTSNPINMAGRFSLSEVAVINKRAQFFIGVDTAIMHISAANNTPTLAFFGPSGGDHWGPWDNDVPTSGYTRRNGVQTMGKHIIIAETRGCQPCGRDGCNGTKISDCLMGLDFEVIKKAIYKQLK